MAIEATDAPRPYYVPEHEDDEPRRVEIGDTDLTWGACVTPAEVVGIAPDGWSGDGNKVTDWMVTARDPSGYVWQLEASDNKFHRYVEPTFDVELSFTKAELEELAEFSMMVDRGTGWEKTVSDLDHKVLKALIDAGHINLEP